MCTVSWLREPAGYHVFFNRDERRTRLAADPPTRFEHRGTRILAPRDGDALGTWIGVNHHGLTLTLLNRWEESPSGDGERAGDAGLVSRGILVRGLLDAVSAEEVGRRLRAGPQDRYRPFTLICFTPGLAAHGFDWDGRRLLASEFERSGLLRTSSGFDQQEAARIRTGLFARVAADAVGLTVETLEALHRSHDPERGAFSVCMHRSDAATVSLTRVSVTPAGIMMRYTAGAPCTAEPGAEQVLSAGD